MAANVTERLQNESPRLVEKMATNPDLCNVVLALLGRCILESQKRGLPIEGIEIGPLSRMDLPNGDLVIRAKVEFRHVALSAPAIWPLQSDFAQYARAKANGMALALQKNPRIGGFFQKLVETIESWSLHKRLAFGSIVVKQAILSTADILVLKVGDHLLDH